MRSGLLTLCITALLFCPLASAKPSPGKHEQDVIRFFLNHPKLANTPAGQRELWKIQQSLWNKLEQANQKLRSLQSERAKWGNREWAHLAISRVFGIYTEQAMRVSGCETGNTWDPRASNGQYLGIFQMGSHERATYGHGSSWKLQAEAAYRYFVASGKDWSPWSCGWAA